MGVVMATTPMAVHESDVKWGAGLLFISLLNGPYLQPNKPIRSIGLNMSLRQVGYGSTPPWFLPR